MRLFNPALYEPVHLLIVLGFSLFFFFVLFRKNSQRLLNRRNSFGAVYFYALLFVIIVGLRPISGVFGDTVNYATTYNNMRFSMFYEFGAGKDRLFYLLMFFCSKRMDVQWFFLIIEALYVFPMAWGCYRIAKNNGDLMLLFCLAAFSFFTYGVNGLRNGMACSFVILAISFIQGNLGEKLLCVILCYLAYSFHSSTALPIMCMLVAFLVKEPRMMFSVWGIAIILSLVASGPITSFLANLGFDDRLADYITEDSEGTMAKFSRTGFRWDFLLYSFMPILLGWFVVFRRKFFDKTYLLLLGTYMYSNAFWVIVIRAAYSNRFAYLSWFLYPIVLSYPLLKLPLWKNTQGNKMGIIMLGHLAFTMLMAFI